jgi:hypothetical protein
MIDGASNMFDIVVALLERAREKGLELKPLPRDEYPDAEPELWIATPDGHYAWVHESWVHLGIAGEMKSAEFYSDLVPGYTLDQINVLPVEGRPDLYGRFTHIRFRRDESYYDWRQKCNARAESAAETSRMRA